MKRKIIPTLLALALTASLLSGILIGAEAPLKFCGGQPAQPRGINPLGGGVEVAGLIGPQEGPGPPEGHRLHRPGAVSAAVPQ